MGKGKNLQHWQVLDGGLGEQLPPCQMCLASLYTSPTSAGAAWLQQGGLQQTSPWADIGQTQPETWQDS